MLQKQGMSTLIVGKRAVQPTDKGNEPDDEMFLNLILERPDAIDENGERSTIVLSIPFDQEGKAIKSKPELLHPGHCTKIFFL